MPDGENLELLFVYGDSPPDVTAQWRTFPLAAPLPVSGAVRTRRPVALLTPEALRESAPGLGDTVERAQISAGIAYPLLQGELAIGAIGFTFGTPEHLTAEQERFLAQLAQQCADALERARLVDAERVAQEHARRLLALSDALAGSGSPASAAEIAARHALEGLGAQTAAVFLTDGDGAQQLVASHGIPREMAEEHGRVPAEMGTPVTDSARTGTVVLLASPRESRARYPALVDLWESAGIRSVAVFPLMRPGNEGTPVIGSLGVSFSEPRDLGADDRAFARMVAQQAAQAIERGRLLQGEREARAYAEEANRAKSEFLASMSHELRTPLNAIGGYVDLISMGIRGPVTDAQRQDLDRVNAAQRHLLRLINSVLDFSKAEAGRIDFHIEELPVDELLAAVEPLVAPQLRAKAQRFTSEPSGSPARVRADREKVAQILLNLVSNAIKFTSAGGSITLAAEPRGEEVAIRVSDTGRGLPADKLEAVFEPFVQVDNRLTEGHGTGLGLAISRELARGMKGDLTVTSEPGVGSVFTLMLPGA
jgi:signal transduction histidine kinase